MKKLHIKWLYDNNDCETCGPSYAEGATVTLDNKVLLSNIPIAHCCGGSNWSRDQIYQEILEKLGYNTTEEEDY